MRTARLLTAVVALALSGCSGTESDDGPDPAAYLASIDAPGAQWRYDLDSLPAAAGTEFRQSPSDDVGIPVGSDGDEGTAVEYAVSWTARLTPRNGEQRCAEAVAWLEGVAATLPGEPKGPENDPADAAERCLKLVGRAPDPQTSGSDTFGSTTNSYVGGHQYGPFLTFLTNGRAPRLLVASVMVQRDV